MPVFTSKLVSLLSTLHVVVEAFDDVDNLLWYTIGPKGAPQTFPVHAVKSLLKVYKVDVELSLPLSALFYDVIQGEDLVCASLSFPKSCLLSSQLLVHCVWLMILASIWLSTDSKVIPRQLLQLLRAPFFGIFTMTLSVQSSGNFIPFQMSAKSGWSRSAASCGSALNTSVLRLSCPREFSVLEGLDGCYDLFFSWGIGVDIQVCLCLLYICLCWWWWWSVQNFTEVFRPSCVLFGFCRD